MVNEHLTQKCPYCGEEISVTANKCEFCGEVIDNVDASETALDNQLEDKRVIRSFKTHDPTWFQKIMVFYGFTPKGWRLDELSTDGKNLTISTRAGNRLTAPIEELSYSYQVNQYDWHEVYIAHGDKKIHFREVPYMLTEAEWEEIFSILDTIPNAHEKSVSKVLRVLESIRSVIKG